MKKIIPIMAGLVALVLSGCDKIVWSSVYEERQMNEEAIFSKKRVNEVVLNGQINFNLDNKEFYNEFSSGDKVDVTYTATYRYDFNIKDEFIGKEFLGYSVVSLLH